jgi:hypothetical protein
LASAVTSAPASTSSVEIPLAFLPSALAYPGQFAVVAILVGATVSLFVKRRRARGVERAQLSWVVYGLVVFALVLILTTGYVFGSIALGRGDPGDSAWTGLFLVMILFPLSFGVAVMRYRLFDIDRIVSRTVSYALVGAVLVLLFAAAVTTLAIVLPGKGSLSVAGSTLAVAAMFNPVRRRIQSWVDRRFNRRHYDADQVAAAFAARCMNETDSDRLVAGWVDVVSGTMQPSGVGVWIRRPVGGLTAAAAPGVRVSR